jgi:hypothetical protein
MKFLGGSQVKKFFSILAVLSLGLYPSLAVARILPTTNTLAQSTPDAFDSFGGGCSQSATGSTITGCEDVIDFNGNFLPTTANTQALGTSLLPWSNVYSVSVTPTGNSSLGAPGITLQPVSTTTALGSTAASQDSILGILVLPAYQEGSSDAVGFGVTASTVIPANASHVHIIGVGTSVTLTSVPNVSTTTVVGGNTLLPDGTYLVIDSSDTAGNVIFQSSNTLTGSQLALGATSRAVTEGHVLVLMFSLAEKVWKEISYR